jgi:calcineurin-like phosphoesterase family protein
MRTFAIGDIHGCLRALQALLAEVNPQHDDCVVTLGDYIDRGPDSKGVLDAVLSLGKRCRHVPLKGNHDLMMLSAREDRDHFSDWLLNGGDQTLASYKIKADWKSFAEAIPAAHWRYLESDCLPYYETERHLFVHANLYADVPLDEQPDFMLFWEKLVPDSWRPHESGKTMICGHTAQRSGRPLALEHAVCIDTCVYRTGWLTCMDVDSDVYWQANESGETRMDRLEFRSR